MESWITLFTAYGKAKVQLSHILQTELPTIPKDSQLYTFPQIPTFEKSKLSSVNPLFKAFSDKKVWILFWLSLVKNGNKLVETELNNSVFLILS